MDAGDLTDIQVQILKLVHKDEGRTATEGIYDLVEAKRPTFDAEGEQLDPDIDIYETSREELGPLERGGLLAGDYETNLVMGLTVFTDAGWKMADELFPEENPSVAELKRRVL